jgi:hypothetical protein
MEDKQVKMDFKKAGIVGSGKTLFFLNFNTCRNAELIPLKQNDVVQKVLLNKRMGKETYFEV